MMNKEDPNRIKRFVFTGTLTEKRKHLQELCEENGDVLEKSITKKTDFLVIGESPGNSKLDKAERYGTEVISEAQFRNMLE